MQIKKPTLGTLINLFDEISTYRVSNGSFYTGILRSTRKRRLRDPQNPGKDLPAHSEEDIKIQEEERIETMIESVEDYALELRKHFGLPKED